MMNPEPNRRLCQLYHEGVVPYHIAWEWQQSVVARKKAHPETKDVLLLLEHPPVYTLGQGATTEFLNFDPADTRYEVCRVERGGEVTYHAPGQLVGYPILDLKHYQPDLHWYLRQLEEVVIRAIAPFGLQGERIAGLTGVWVDGHKIAAIGIKVSRWITMHGFAINVCPDLEGFRQIVPCGIRDRPVGSLAQFIPGISVSQVRHELVTAFAEVMNVSLIPANHSFLIEPASLA
ncbi:lipoyl(octanoyl) transferase LipB [Leptolyngbya sp. AN02str]|uniref:lipoyl(octanoyl) transferase LipB n=1 Tax=Leptolyngbya sp. AN02str TaxID=3423363 RepID=UPI003D320E2F